MRGDKLIALASVELVIAGVSLTLHGLQVQRGQQAGAEATAVTLPRYRSAAGDWRSAVTLPDDTKPTDSTDNARIASLRHLKRKRIYGIRFCSLPYF